MRLAGDSVLKYLWKIIQIALIDVWNFWEKIIWKPSKSSVESENLSRCSFFTISTISVEPASQQIKFLYLYGLGLCSYMCSGNRIDTWRNREAIKWWSQITYNFRKLKFLDISNVISGKSFRPISLKFGIGVFEHCSMASPLKVLSAFYLFLRYHKF